MCVYICLCVCFCVCVCVCVCVCACFLSRAHMCAWLQHVSVSSSYLGGEGEPQRPGVDHHTCEDGLEDSPQEAVQTKHQGVAFQPQRLGNLEAKGRRLFSKLPKRERMEKAFFCFATYRMESLARLTICWMAWLISTNICFPLQRRWGFCFTSLGFNHVIIANLSFIYSVEFSGCSLPICWNKLSKRKLNIWMVSQG